MALSLVQMLKSIAAGVVVLAALSAPQAQISGGSTGWCSDYEGNNFPCSDAPSSGGGGGYDYGGYGGGCATAAYNSDAAIEAENARSFVSMGNTYFDQQNYMQAADAYYNAVQSDGSNTTAHRNLAAALSYVGKAASQRGDDMSSYLYNERSYQHWPENDNIRGNFEYARNIAPSKSCSTCAKAIMSDIAYGLGSSTFIYSYVHQATANYDNCTRELSCGDTDGASFRYLARQSCYQTYLSSESGFRACLQQALEDRGYTFW